MAGLGPRHRAFRTKLKTVTVGVDRPPGTAYFRLAMCKSSYPGRHASSRAGWWLCCMLATAWTMGAAPSFATCLVSKDPDVRELQTLVDKDAARALKQVAARLQPLEQAPQPDAQLLAPLYAVQAQAYSMLELDDDARKAASKGLQFATRIGDPVRLDLLSAHAENVYDAAGMDAAIKTIDEARASQAPGSLADTCLLITRGVLQRRQDRTDLAIGDFTQALALNQEVIDWDTEHGATLSLSVDRFLRGKIFNLMGKYASAIEEFAEARKLSVQSNDTQGVAFADLHDCTARIELGQLQRAALECDHALRGFTAAHSADEVKDALALLARIDLAIGQIDAGQQRQGILHLVGGMGRGKPAQRMIALQCGTLQLTQFYPGSAIVQIGKRHALGIVRLHAQLARFREFLDRGRILPHQVENLSPQESVDGKTQRRAVLGVPVDH